MFGAFDLRGCTRAEVVSTLLGGSPSAVVEAVLRGHYEDRVPRDVLVEFGDGAPVRETLDAHVRALNAYLERLRET